MAVDNVRHEELAFMEKAFLAAVERVYFSDEVRELAKKLAALPERTAVVRLQLSLEAAKVTFRGMGT